MVAFGVSPHLLDPAGLQPGVTLREHRAIMALKAMPAKQQDTLVHEVQPNIRPKRTVRRKSE